MQSPLTIDIATLDTSHRRAPEEVIGRQLATNQRIIISVTEVEMQPAADSRPIQTLDDWTKVDDGLSDQEIEEIDKVAKTRANLTRHLP